MGAPQYGDDCTYPSTGATNDPSYGTLPSGVTAIIDGAVYGGDWTGAASITTSSTTDLKGGTFPNITSYGAISGGSATFSGYVENYGTISNGVFNSDVYNYSLISGGTFESSVSNYGGISDGIFNSYVVNDSGTISGGTFSITSDVSNQYLITGGSYYGKITNNLDFMGGYVYGELSQQGATLAGIDCTNMTALTNYNSPRLDLIKGINGSGILGML
jgi:hypothetical protein